MPIFIRQIISVSSFEFISLERRYFNLIYRNQSKIDAILKKRSSLMMVQNVTSSIDCKPGNETGIGHEHRSKLESNSQSHHEKYDIDESDKNEVVLFAQRSWYGFKGDWSMYFNAAKESMTKHESKLQAAEINEFAWYLFFNSNDSSILKTALNWSNRAVELCETGFLPNHLDTKANLLYKLGNKSEAIAVQEEALKLATEQNNPRCIKQSSENIAKMKRGEPTWNMEATSSN